MSRNILPIDVGIEFVPLRQGQEKSHNETDFSRGQVDRKNVSLRGHWLMDSVSYSCIL